MATALTMAHYLTVNPYMKSRIRYVLKMKKLLTLHTLYYG